MSRPALIARLVPFLVLTGAPLAQQRLFGETHQMFAGASGWTNALLFADLTGDGASDVLEANDTTTPGASAPALALYAGSGTGGFAPVAAGVPDVGTDPRTLAALDVELDGDLDVVVWQQEVLADPFGGSSPQGEQNALLLSDGAGGWTDGTAAVPVLLDQTVDLAVADLDGNGADDVYVANTAFLVFPSLTANNDDRVWLGDGVGGFQELSAAATSSFAAAQAVELGDLDGDGDVDALVSIAPGHGAEEVLLNDGTGFFTDASGGWPLASTNSPFALADVDGDGDADAISGENLLLNDGSGVFSDASAAIPNPRFSTAIATADLDGDGDVDALAVSGLPELDDLLLLGDGAGGFVDDSISLPSASENGRDVAFEDVDGDGDADVLLATSTTTLLWLGDGAGALADTVPVPAMPGAYCGAIVDLNADGVPDVVLGTGGALHDGLYLSDGQGGLVDASATLPFDNGASRDLDVGDLDGDGDPDVVLANDMWQQNRLFLNDGQGGFADGTGGFPASSSHTRAVRAADLDGDADLDLLFGNTGWTAPSYFWRNLGGGAFQDDSLLLPSAISDQTTAIAVLDVDLDGDLDAVFTEEFSKATLYLNQAGAGFSVGPDPDIAGGNDVGAGDFDNDGDGDLLVVGATDGLYLGDGVGGFADWSGSLPVATGDSESVALGDVDGDGDLDAYVGNDGANALLIGGPGHNFFDGTYLLPSTPGEWTFGIALGDVDADGDADAVELVLAGESHLLHNHTQHLAWRELPRVGKPLTFDVSGDSGQLWVLAASPGLAPGPVPPWGTLWLALPGVVVAGSGSLDANGSAAPTFAVPAGAAWIGTTWYWQALVGAPLRFTNLERTTFTDL